jgi:hypothetical protein
MHRTLPLFFAVAALAFCAGKTYTFTLLQPAVVGTTELKPGEHRLMLDGNIFVVDGKADTRTTVKVETVSEKFNQTSVRTDSSGGKPRIQEIRLGGSSTKLVVAESGSGSSAGAGSGGSSGVND